MNDTFYKITGDVRKFICQLNVKVKMEKFYFSKLLKI
jgi:hypothetical protein